MPITLLFTVIFKIFVIFLLFARLLLYLLIEESSYIPILWLCHICASDFFTEIDYLRHIQNIAIPVAENLF